MADQADVETALAAIVANSLYPNGTGVPSVTGNVCRIYRGFPNAPSLDADLAAGVINISIAATDGAVRNVTRYPRRWVSVAPVGPVLSVEVAAQAAVFSGDCAVGQLAGVKVNGVVYPYAVQGNDSPATVASNLAALLRAGGWVVDYAGAAVGVPGAETFTARVVSGAGALQEIKRQIQDFRITLWCPDPAARDAVAPVIDQVLTGLKFIALADGSSAHLVFAGSVAGDNAADATLYRRDLTYSAEYPTTLAQMTPAMLFGVTSVSVNAAFVENIQS
ncbi:hypothetical protein GCM10010909_22490 [Acidocella aquatica]|uniref:Baseplate protein J-like domain-containing protein n=1 Tax=Acidocella aquatica TaxID=1922313 RepID=A0ABQ6A7E9_9PROT|nr:hypothetical protein [Acidocella aquatica]GLR67568.1 hypothetical protein GCM10010909_22490 [Acidocella aquatica]